jgi:hypothetical protein
MLKAVGKTEDGRFVLSGVYRAYETLGLPLEIILDEFQKRNVQISWLHFIEESIHAGRKREKVLATCKSVICEVYGHEYYKEWSHRLKARIVDFQSADRSSILRGTTK